MQLITKRQKNESMDYSNYNLEDFVQDKDFRAWVLSSDPESDAFWHQWMERNPGKTSMILEARSIIHSLKFREYALDPLQKEQLWNRINTHVSSPTEKTVPVRYMNIDRLKKKTVSGNHFARLVVAASICLFLIMSVFQYMLTERERTDTYVTGFSETKEIVLRDGTGIVLNANSTLKVPDYWAEGGVREVWLTGEAYFDVASSDVHKEFIVHTDLIDVLVLGTKFNVYNRYNRSLVELASGRVMLSNNTTNNRIEMEPGDQVLYETAYSTPVVRKINTTEVSAWRENLLIFRRTSLDEIAALLKSNYNLELIFTDRSTANHYFTGTVSSNDIDLLLTTLSKTFDLDIERKGDTVIIKPRGERK